LSLPAAHGAGTPGRLRSRYDLTQTPVSALRRAAGRTGQPRPRAAGGGAPPLGMPAHDGQNGQMSPDPTTAEHPDTFGAKTQLAVGDRSYEIFNIKAPALADRHDVDGLLAALLADAATH